MSTNHQPPTTQIKRAADPDSDSAFKPRNLPVEGGTYGDHMARFQEAWRHQQHRHSVWEQYHGYYHQQGVPYSHILSSWQQLQLQQLQQQAWQQEQQQQAWEEYHDYYRRAGVPYNQIHATWQQYVQQQQEQQAWEFRQQERVPGFAEAAAAMPGEPVGADFSRGVGPTRGIFL